MGRKIIRVFLYFIIPLFIVPKTFAINGATGASQSPPPKDDSGYSLTLPTIQTGEPLDITLKEAVVKALSHNHEILIEKITTDISRTQIRKEEGVFDPTVKAEVTQNHADSIDAAGLSSVTKATKGAAELSKTFSPGTTVALTYDTADSQSVSATGRYQSNFKITVTQDLLKNFGTDINRAKVRIARKGLEQAAADYGQQVVETVADVQEAYWDLYKSSETLAVRKGSFALTNGLLSKKRIEAKLGAIATIDLVEIEADVATKITDYTDALKQVRDDEIKLRSLLALPMNSGPTSRPLRPKTGPLPRPLQFDYEKIVAGVLAGNLGYQSILREKEAKEIETDYSRNQLLPSLQAKASVGTQNQANQWGTSAKTTDGGNSYEVGLVMTMPMGNRSAKATHRKSILELKKIEARLRQKEDAVRKEVSIALVAVEQNAMLVEAAKTGVRIKQINLEATEKKLQFGTGSLRDILDRQTDLVDARLKRLQAEIDYQKAVISLYKSQGLVDPDLQIEFLSDPLQKP